MPLLHAPMALTLSAIGLDGRKVAVKLLSGRLTSNPSSVERFRQEGRVASQITHPHCVFVLGADADVVEAELGLAVGKQLRVSEELLGDDDAGEVYVYKRSPSPRAVLERLERKG